MGVSNFDCVGIGKVAGNGLFTAGVGYAPANQLATIARDATLVQSATFTIPTGSTILGIDVYVDTAYDSATSATLTVGTAAAGTQYVTSVNAKTGGFAAATHTAAQTTAMSNITTTTVVATITSVGQPTVGTVRVNLRYLVPTT